MQKSLHKINQGINNLAYYWSFPEIVANTKGFYREEGIELVIHDVTPSGVVSDKSEMYKDLQKEGKQDVYHAAEYVCITRAIGNTTGSIIAYSPWVEGGLNASFGLYVKPKSIKKPEELKDESIAIENGTGSYYTTIEDLETFMPKDSIKLTQIGDPHLRLVALAKGEVAAASLMGPYADLAEHMGMTKVIESRRRKGTLMIARNDIGTATLAVYLRATNRAIEEINEKPKGYRTSYYTCFKKIIPRLADELKEPAKSFEHAIKVPRWKRWGPYSKAEFEGVYGWMVERKLIEPSHRYEKLVDMRAFS